jgi:hypothetical protein
MKLSWKGTVIAGALVATLGCDQESTVEPVRPQRVYSPESVVVETGSFSESTNLLGYRLSLLLDYIPTEPGKAALAQGCMDPLEPNFEIGYAVCNDEARTKLPIYARHVDQRCEVPGMELVQSATDTLLTEECTEINVRTYLFDPPLRIYVHRAE